MQSGTDNEGYGRLLGPYDGGWHAGDDLEPIVFCPWCGKKLPAISAEEESMLWKQLEKNDL